MKNNRSASLFPKELVVESLKQSFVKLHPRTMFRNPIMFTVEVCTIMLFLVSVYIAITGTTGQGSFGHNMIVFLVLLVTLLFANFAEAIAEARGKAQAMCIRDSLGSVFFREHGGFLCYFISRHSQKKVAAALVQRFSQRAEKFAVRVAVVILKINLSPESP